MNLPSLSIEWLAALITILVGLGTILGWMSRVPKSKRRKAARVAIDDKLIKAMTSRYPRLAGTAEQWADFIREPVSDTTLALERLLMANEIVKTGDTFTAP